MSSRRNVQTAPPAATESSTLGSSASNMDRPTNRSPFLPTRLEALLLSIYPSTLLFGSVFSQLSSSTRGVPYSGVLQSHPPEFAPSYFARKRNVFNVYFVKVGWFWTTLAFTILIFTHPWYGPPLRPYVTPRRIRGVLRWASITAWWVSVTQWFFGPPLIDRGFRFTGGQCELVLRDDGSVRSVPGMSNSRELLTAAACKLAGGTWKGGHDISGHVFLLILGSALLWFELLPTLTRAEGLRDGRTVMRADGRVTSLAAEARVAAGEKRERPEDQVTKAGVKIALGIVALMWWMLLMTAAFFHTWVEKFTGLLVAFAGLWVVYFLPRGVPPLRGIIGMPGL